MSAAIIYDGLAAEALTARLRIPRIVLVDRIGSTLDAAHQEAAAGAPDGTLVLADAQTAGRGRQGRSWQSEAGRGIWLTLVERLTDSAAREVFSLRIGLAAAPVLDTFATAPVQLKWPNDLYVGGRKLAGVLVEARWKADRLDWLAVGLGVNVHPPTDVPTAIGLADGVRRVDVLERLVPALRAAARCTGPLTTAELKAFAARDLARGRACSEPAPGTVMGIDATGALVLDTAAGHRSFRAGSLVLSGEVP